MTTADQESAMQSCSVPDIRCFLQRAVGRSQCGSDLWIPISPEADLGARTGTGTHSSRSAREDAEACALSVHVQKTRVGEKGLSTKVVHPNTRQQNASMSVQVWKVGNRGLGRAAACRVGSHLRRGRKLHGFKPSWW